MFEAAFVCQLGGTVLFQYEASSEATDLAAFTRQVLLEGNASSRGRQDFNGQTLEWLIDGTTGLLFVTARPRVSAAPPAFLENLRSSFLTCHPHFRSRPFCDILVEQTNHTSYGLDVLLPTFASVFADLVSRSEGNTLSPSNVAKAPDSSMVPAKSSLKVNSDPVKAKVARSWGNDIDSLSNGDMQQYDYSDAQNESSVVNIRQSGSFVGKRSRDGSYAIAELEELKPATTTESRLGGLFTRLGLTAKRLTTQDLQPALIAMQELLMSKNVAQAVAADICRSVGTDLEGQAVAAFAGGVERAVRKAMEAALTRLLTPRASTDLLGDIAKRQRSRLAGESAPYVLTFVGVNGVGKSTNLSKIAFWLLQNNLKVLIAACDTFRSGAVEQLRTHVRNLGQLEVRDGLVGDKVELYEKGYGKDAAGIAKDAIAYARAKDFQVVLIDTAGRMQDNEPLMRALAKLVSVNHPDKVIFVGEALAGNEALDQLRKFDDALRRFSGLSGKSRGIDGILLTKYETVDEKVGAAVSMTSLTGAPLIGVGVGQTYGDLRTLRTSSIVDALMR